MAPARGPVFVDASGRRLRRVRLIGGVALAVVGGYVVLLLVALLGGPNVAAPYLPQPAAPTANAAATAPPTPSPSAAQTTHASGEAQAEPQGPAQAAIPVAALAPNSGPTPVAGAAPAPIAAPATAAAPVSSAATAPGKSGSAPGQTTRPTSPSHP